jgi:hypothetical protein
MHHGPINLRILLLVKRQVCRIHERLGSHMRGVVLGSV